MHNFMLLLSFTRRAGLRSMVLAYLVILHCSRHNAVIRLWA